MRNIVKTLVIVFVLFAVPSFATPGQSDAVHVLSTKRYIFYFKVEKELIGGSVQVFDKGEKMVATAKIEHAKNIVDFFYLPAGIYNVKIKKGAEEFVFPYVNGQ